METRRGERVGENTLSATSPLLKDQAMPSSPGWASPIKFIPAITPRLANIPV